MHATVRLNQFESSDPSIEVSSPLSVRQVRRRLLLVGILVAAFTGGLLLMEHRRLSSIAGVASAVNRIGRQRSSSEQLVRLAVGAPVTDGSAAARAFRSVGSLQTVMQTAHDELARGTFREQLRPVWTPHLEEHARDVQAQWESLKERLPQSGETLSPSELSSLHLQRDRYIDAVDQFTLAAVDAAELAGQQDTRLRAWATTLVFLVLIGAWFGVAHPGLRMLARQAQALSAQNERYAKAMARLKSLQQALDQHSLVTIGDIDGTILDANELFCRATGYTRQELVGHNHRIVNSGVHPRMFWSNLYRTVAKGQSWQGDVCNRNRDGSLGWYATTVTPMMDDAGRIEFLVSLRTDVTHLRQMEAHLAETSARLDAILSALPDAVLDLDQHGRILEVKIGSSTPRELAQRLAQDGTLTEVLPDGPLDELIEALSNVAYSGLSSHGSFTLRLAGRACHLEYTLSRRSKGTQEAGDRLVLVLSDVTARREMADALSAANRRFALAQRSMMLAVWDRDPVTGVVTWDAPEDTFGPAHLLPHSTEAWAEVIHGDDRERVLAEWWTAVQTGAEFAAEYRMTLSGGRERWVHVTGSPVEGETGNPPRYVGLLADIHERHRLQEVADRLALVARHTNNAVVITDTTGRVEWVNEGFTRLTGWAAADVVGRPAGLVLCGQDLETPCGCALSEAFGRAEATTLEATNWHRDGSPIHVTIELEPLCDPVHGLTGFMVIESDITARVRAQQGLAEERERLQFAMMVGGLGMWDWDIRTGAVRLSEIPTHTPTGQVAEDNQDLTIQWIADGIDPEDWAMIQERLALHFAGETPDFWAVYRKTGPDGKTRWNESRGRVSEWAEDGSPVRMIGTTADVTTRETAAERLSESERRFRTIANATPAMIWVTGPAGELSYLNDRWSDLSGDRLTSADAWWALVHPDERDAVRAEWTAAVAAREPFELVYRCQRHDGVERWMLNRGIPNTGPDGTYHGYVGTVLDLTEQRIAEEALRNERARLAAFVEHAPAAIAMFDGEMRYVAHSQKWLSDYGLDHQTLVGQSHYDVFPEMPEHWREEHQQALAGFVRRNDSDAWHPDGWGHEQVLRWELRPWTTGDGTVGGILMFTEDVTTMKVIEQTLRANEMKFRSLFELAPVGLSLSRAENLALVQTNRALQRMAGYTDDELRRLTLADLVADDAQATFRVLTEELAERGEAGPLELSVRHHEGHTVPVLVNCVQMTDEDGTSVVWSIVQDISERKEWEAAVNDQVESIEFFSQSLLTQKEELERSSTELRHLNEQLAHQSVTDPLTGLPNRRGFNRRLAEVLADRRAEAKEGIAALFMDLDNFKLINDSLGHEAGDQLLVQVAARLKASVRDGGMVGRFAGDEFTVLLPGVPNAEAAMTVANRILEVMREPFVITGTQMAIRFSIGVAYERREDISAEGLMRDADAALYVAKDRGKGQSALFEPWMHASAERRRRVEMELRLALERGEITTVYQPIIDLNSYTIQGVEALARWDHPVEGRLSPAQFLDIAEEAGLMRDLGACVLRQVMKDLNQWRLGPDETLRVFVNVSSQEFNDPTYLDRLERILSENRVNPRRLVMEITEGTLMADYANATTRLTAMREMGLSTAMDDFGAGQSSLGRLSAIPVDLVKTDRSLTAQTSKDFRTLAVVRAIAALCGAIGVEVLAEGVEDEDALMMAMSVGCRYAQGHFLSLPLTPEELDALRHTWKAPRLTEKAS